jgi:hypothetical protein
MKVQVVSALLAEKKAARGRPSLLGELEHPYRVN